MILALSSLASAEREVAMNIPEMIKEATDRIPNTASAFFIVEKRLSLRTLFLRHWEVMGRIYPRARKQMRLGQRLNERTAMVPGTGNLLCQVFCYKTIHFLSSYTEKPCRDMLKTVNDNHSMRKIELLAPAGDMTSLIAAVDAGADAVYLGVGRFNARRRAENFAEDALAEAVRYAHLRGVKVYVAINTLVRGVELEDVAETVCEAYRHGIDAAIVQDWGVAKIVRTLAPEMGVHASTQMNAHNRPMLELLESKGFKRATLARELTIDEVANLAGEHSIEIEVFTHGALCFSYSGQCLISSLVSGRSGNRGLCPQVCRFPYELYQNDRKLTMPGKHILSTRDLCTLTMLNDLVNAGVSSLKIEGRLKSPHYVGTVTRVYRRALDRIEAGVEHRVSVEEIDELRMAFSRGFTEGYLKGIRDGRMMSFGRPSNRGVMVGRIAFVDVYKGEVGISLQRALNLGDIVEIWISRGGRIKKKVDSLTVGGTPVDMAAAGKRAVIKTSEKLHKISNGDRVFLVARDPTKRYEGRRLPIKLKVSVSEGSPLEVRATAGDVTVLIAGERIAETARDHPLTEEMIARQLNKLGGTAYKTAIAEVIISGRPMLPVAEINKARRRMVAYLDEARLAKYGRTVVPYASMDKHIKAAKIERRTSARLGLKVSVSDAEGAIAAIEAGADEVYLKIRSPLGFDKKKIKLVVEGLPAIRPSFGNIVRDFELAETVAVAVEIWGGGVALCDNMGLAKRLKEAGFDVVLDYHLNLLNGLACRELSDLRPVAITASVEADIKDLKEICGSEVPIELVVHGSMEVMTAEHPIVNPADIKDVGCVNLEIIDPKGFRFPVLIDQTERTHIYNSKELCLLEELPKAAETGVAFIRLLLEGYSPEEIASVCSMYCKALDELAHSGSIEKALAEAEGAHISFTEHTTGHFYRPVL